MHEKRSRRQFVKGTLGFLGGIGLTRIAGLFPESQFLLAQTRQEGNVIFSQENSFQKYTDEDYHFTLEYPSGWSIESNVKQVPPYPVPEAIIKRTTFFTPNGLVDIDMWTLQGQEFSLWLQNYAQTRNMPEILNASEGKIAGQEAKFFLLEGQTDRYTVFFSDGAYAYRLWNLVPDSTPALAGFWHMLDTFKLSDTTGQAATIPASIPQILTPTNNNISMVNSCCGYTCVGNPFTCCSQSNGYKGNCVWWVYYRYCSSGGVPFRGSAWEWWGEVLDHLTQWERNTTPKPNIANICWWSANHVAFAANYVAGSSTIAVTDMTCTTDWNCVRTRNSLPISNPNGYIRRCTVCPS